MPKVTWACGPVRKFVYARQRDRNDPQQKPDELLCKTFTGESNKLKPRLEGIKKDCRGVSPALLKERLGMLEFFIASQRTRSEKHLQRVRNRTELKAMKEVVRENERSGADELVRTVPSTLRVSRTARKPKPTVEQCLNTNNPQIAARLRELHALPIYSLERYERAIDANLELGKCDYSFSVAVKHVLKERSGELTKLWTHRNKQRLQRMAKRGQWMKDIALEHIPCGEVGRNEYSFA